MAPGSKTASATAVLSLNQDGKLCSLSSCNCQDPRLSLLYALIEVLAVNVAIDKRVYLLDSWTVREAKWMYTKALL